MSFYYCTALGCGTDPQLDPPSDNARTGSGGGSYNVAAQTVTLSTLQTSNANILSVIRNNPSSLVVTEQGVQYWKFINPNVSPLFNYANEIRVLKTADVPPAATSAGWDALRARYVSDLDKLSVGVSFKSNLLSSFDYIRTLNGKTFAQFETYFENKLYNIANPSPLGSKLSVNECFALTQAYYALLTHVKWVYQNPSSAASGSGPCDLTREEWIDVAEATFIGGMSYGLAVGGNWAIQGGLATGGHPAGAVVGGLIGFATGFIGGAAGGGGLKLMWECLENKLFDIKIMYNCNGKFIFALPNQTPPSYPCVQWSSPGVSIPQVNAYAFVPNKGKTALASQTITDINWLLGYF